MNTLSVYIQHGRLHVFIGLEYTQKVRQYTHTAVAHCAALQRSCMCTHTLLEC